MGIRTQQGSTPTLIDNYIDTNYDKVETVYENLAAIINVSNIYESGGIQVGDPILASLSEVFTVFGTAVQIAADPPTADVLPTTIKTYDGGKLYIRSGNHDLGANIDMSGDNVWYGDIDGQIDLATYTLTLSGVSKGTIRIVNAANNSLVISGRCDNLIIITDNTDAIDHSSATGAYIINGISYNSNLSSPTLTGTPIAPTAAADTDTTQIATTAYVLGQANDASPQTLGTASAGTSEKYLRADTIFSDQLPATTVLADGATGTTQSDNDNSTKLATTAYVDTASDSKVTDEIVEDVTAVAPSQNAVFDALALKANLAGADFTDDITIAGTKSLSVDTINEKTSTSGVTIDSVLLKDGLVDGIDVATRDGNLLTAEATLEFFDIDASATDDTFDVAADNTLTYKGAVIITGDVTIQGTTFTVDSTTLEVEDKNIVLGNVETPSDVTADGGGITLKGATDKTIIWDNANDNFTSSEHINLATGKEFKVNNVSILTATTLGSAVVNSSLTNVGTLTELQVDNININGSTLSHTADANMSISAYAGKNVTIEGATFDNGAIGATSLTLTDGPLTISGNGTYLGFPVMTDANAAAGADGKSYFSSDTNELKVYANGIYTSVGGGGGSWPVSQAAHSFVVGTPIYLSASDTYAAAQADTEVHAELAGIVSIVIDAGNFMAQQSGPITLTTGEWDARTGETGGLEAGKVYFLDPDNAGKYINEDDIDGGTFADGEVERPALLARSTTQAIILPYRGSVIGGTYSRGTSFVAGDLTANVLTFSHNLDTQYPIIWVYDNNGAKIDPTNIEPTSGSETTSSDITLSEEDVTAMSTNTWYVKGIGTGVGISFELSNSAPESVGVISTAGTATDISKSDHVHADSPSTILDRLIKSIKETTNDVFQTVLMLINGFLDQFITTTGIDASSSSWFHQAGNKIITNDGLGGFISLLYSGTGAENEIDGAPFTPDFVWVKSRSDGARYHSIYDKIRGATKEIYPNSNLDEVTNADTLQSFDDDGFTLGESAGPNDSGDTYVAWCFECPDQVTSWAGGGANPTAEWANFTLGFTMLRYTGTGSAHDINHGMGVVPELIIVKEIPTNSRNWMVYHKDLDSSIPQNKYLLLNQDYAVGDATTVWNDTAPTDEKFTVGIDTHVNTSGTAHIAYMFASKAGASKVGYYEGDGNLSQAISGLGFRPAMLLIKDINNVKDWAIFDDERGANYLRPNLTNVEGSGGLVSIDDDGFTVDSNALTNSSGATYIYLAIGSKGAAQDIDLISESQTASSAPDTIVVYALIEQVDSFTLETDLKCWASRVTGADAQATTEDDYWDTGTLTKVCDVVGDIDLIKATIDVSAQTSGTDIRYRFVGANTKKMYFHGVHVVWE